VCKLKRTLAIAGVRFMLCDDRLIFVTAEFACGKVLAHGHALQM